MAQTLTATPDPAYSPPRIRLDFTDTATTPVTSVTINRQDADGRSYAVRTSDGGPLPVSGGAVSIFDFEAPPQEVVTYSTNISGGPTATAQLDVSEVWAVHPGIPSRSVPLTLRVGSNDSEDWDIDQGSFQVLMRSTPIVATGGARMQPASALIVSLETADEKAALKQLLSDGAPLFLSVPPSLGLGIDSAYITVGRVSVARPSGLPGIDPLRDVSLPYQVVARPAGGTRGGLTWDDVAAKYATWADLAATGMTWAQLAAQSA